MDRAAEVHKVALMEIGPTSTQLNAPEVLIQAGGMRVRWYYDGSSVGGVDQIEGVNKVGRTESFQLRP
jgi:hypothetical protein